MLFLEGHRHEVRSIAWSPRGDLLASGGDDRTVRVWRLLPQRLLHTLRGHSRNVYAVGFAPDGRTVISAGGDGQVRLWSVEGGEMRTTPEVHSRSVNCLAIHRQGVIATADGAWRSSSQAIVRQLVNSRRARGIALRGAGPVLTLDHYEVSCLAYAPDGRRLAVGTPQHLFLWAPRRQPSQVMRFGPASPGARRVVEASASGELVLLAEGAWYRSACFSADGAQLAAAADAEVQIWQGERGPTARLRGHAGAVNAVAFSPLGAVLASGGNDGVVRLWDAGCGVERVSFTWDIGPIQSLAFSPDGLSLAAGGERRIVVWDVEAYG